MKIDKRTHYEGCFIDHIDCCDFWIAKMNMFLVNEDYKSLNNLLKRMIKELDTLKNNTNDVE